MCRVSTLVSGTVWCPTKMCCVSQVGQQAAFVVNVNEAKGKLTANVVSPSGIQQEALVQQTEDGMGLCMCVLGGEWRGGGGAWVRVCVCVCICVCVCVCT